MQWTAHYRDGTSLNQFEDGREHLFKEINQTQLVLFEVITDTRKKHQVQIQPGRKLVFFRRHFHKPPPEPEDIHFFLGWQEHYYGHNVTRLLEIKPNGDVELHDHR